MNSEMVIAAMSDGEKAASKEGQEAYKDRPWLVNIPNPYEEGTLEFNAFKEGWELAEFWDKTECGYFDWISEW